MAIPFLETIIQAMLFAIPLIWSKYLNANYVSAKFFMLYFVSALTLIVSTRHVKWPKIPKEMQITLIFLILLHLLSPILTQRANDFYYMFKFFSFACLAYYFYTSTLDLEKFVKNYELVILIVLSLILVFALNDFYINRIEKLDRQSGFLLGSFGNVNMLAEFLILSLPLLQFWKSKKLFIHSFFKNTLFLGWVFFIFYCRSRSVWIGFGLWTVWALYKKKLTKMDMALIFVAFAGYHLSLLAPSVESATVLAKHDSFNQRLQLYFSTLRLIGDHPIGVGVGHFISEIVPYQMSSDFRPLEFVYFDQPHSEILKWAVQFGWLGFVIPAILFFYIIKQLLSLKDFFLFSTLLALIPQICFQFPFENPATILYLAFVFALYVKTYPVAVNYPLRFKKQFLFIIFSFLGMAQACVFVYSIFLETSHGNRLDNIIYSCDIYPTNVNACFNKNHNLMATNNYVQAKESFSETLLDFPFHAGLLRLFPIYLKNKEGDKASCEAVLVYNMIFDKQTFFNSDILKNCSVFKNPIEFKNPEQFKEDYMKWQRQFFK